MNVLFRHHWIWLLAAGLGWVLPVCAGETVSFPEWKGIPRLSVDLAGGDTPPFVELSSPRSASVKTSEPSAASTRQEHEPASPDRAQSARGELRESLLREGESSAADRDALTAEFFSVMRWTVVSLIVGGFVAFALKRFPQWNRPPVTGTKMSVLESLTVGRHQVLNLVQAGGERFLVASDPGGIRSVTLLPNWPSTEEELHDTTSPDTPVKLFPSTDDAPRIRFPNSNAA